MMLRSVLLMNSSCFYMYISNSHLFLINQWSIIND